MQGHSPERHCARHLRKLAPQAAAGIIDQSGNSNIEVRNCWSLWATKLEFRICFIRRNCGTYRRCGLTQGQENRDLAEIYFRHRADDCPKDSHRGGDRSATKTKDITEDAIVKIRAILDRDYVVEGDLRRNITMNIKRLMDTAATVDSGTVKGCLRGDSGPRRTPVRGRDRSGPQCRAGARRRAWRRSSGPACLRRAIP